MRVWAVAVAAAAVLLAGCTAVVPAGPAASLKNTSWVVAEIGGDPVGLAWVIPDGMFGRSPYLRTIGVHPDSPGRGIGSALLRAVEDRVRPALLFLLTSDFNTGAQRLYERHGYTHIGTVPGYVVPGVDELLYLKRVE